MGQCRGWFLKSHGFNHNTNYRITLFYPHNNPRQGLQQSALYNKETEAQEGWRTCPRVLGTLHTRSSASAPGLGVSLHKSGTQCGQMLTEPGQRAAGASSGGISLLVGKRDCLEAVAWHSGTVLGGCSEERRDSGKGSLGEGNVYKGWGKTEVSSGSSGT